MIHGGIRYLENAFKNLDYGQYELVKEALSERAHMLKAAPYMNKPLPIMIPMVRREGRGRGGGFVYYLLLLLDCCLK